MTLEEEFTFSWSHWGDLVGSLSIITTCKTETTPIYLCISLQARCAIHKDFKKHDLIQTQLKILF